MSCAIALTPSSYVAVVPLPKRKRLSWQIIQLRVAVLPYWRLLYRSWCASDWWEACGCHPSAVFWGSCQWRSLRHQPGTWRDVASPSARHYCAIAHQPNCSILYWLEATHQVISDAVVQRVAGIQSTGNECLEHRLCDIIGWTMDDWSQLSQVELAAPTYSSGVAAHAQRQMTVDD